MSKRSHSSGNSDAIQERLQESDVFITEYVNKLTEFSAIIKQRFSDFQVFEIDEEGKEIHLTSTEVNLVSHETPVVNKEEQRDEQVVTAEEYENIDINEQPVPEFRYPLDDDEKWRQLSLLAKRKRKKESMNIDVTGVDKNERKALHGQILQRYNGDLCTRTVDEDDRKLIIVSTNRNTDVRKFQRWSKDTPQYLHFVLYKENFDTISAVRQLCKMLRFSQKLVSYSGTKDRRGVTTQRVCIKQGDAEQISKCVNKHNLWCGHFEYKDEPLQLGQLRGNRFVVALRNVEASDSIIDDTLTLLKERGFINYYGLQRFGSYSSAPTFEIGKCLLQKRWLEAINLILVPPKYEKDRNLLEAINLWKAEGDAKKTLKFLRKNYSVEATILKTLAEQGNTAYVNALQKIPRNIVLLYLHAFQSLVWNRIVSRRIKEHGLNVLVGDLICTAEPKMVLDVEEAENYENEPEKFTETITTISPDEVEKTSIYDVVYPLPGYAIKYPENEIAKWYEEILREYDVGDFSGKNKTFSSCGAYRRMLVLPQDVKWKTIFYDDPSADVLATDLQKLKNVDTVQNLESGLYKAVIVELTLPKCSYATMALREITKMDTSANYQASLSTTHIQSKKPKIEESECTIPS